MELSLDRDGYIVILSTALCLVFGLTLLSFAFKRAVREGQSEVMKSTKRSIMYDNGDVYIGDIQKFCIIFHLIDLLVILSMHLLTCR